MRSISKASAAPTDHATARSRIRIGQYLAALGVEQFAIAQAADGTVRRENHRGGEHGSEQCAAAHFIHAGDALETLGSGIALEFSLAFHYSGVARRQSADYVAFAQDVLLYP